VHEILVIKRFRVAPCRYSVFPSMLSLQTLLTESLLESREATSPV
jgi:hypothetical protein